ncbi:MAG: putative membrane protein [Halioglobus sp.]|jgi:putative membrane protein
MSGSLLDSVMNLRENLAVERTRLANERTFLAYVRTALSLVAGGVVVLQYLAESPGDFFAGWLLAVSGVAVLAIGLVRFITVRAKLLE